MLTKPLSEISIPEDRVRKIFKEEEIESLAESIAEFGLFHAPVLESDEKTLIIGERRFRAISLLFNQNRSFSYNKQEVPLGYLPVVIMDSAQRDKVLGAEIEENVRRVNLTWQEEADAIAKLHQLRSREQEAIGEKQTLTQTANEINEMNPTGTRKLHQDVRHSIILSTWKDDPDVKKATNKKDALKVVEKKLLRAQQEALAKQYDITGLKLEHQLHLGDMRELFSTLENESIDIIIADPPYGINADKVKNQAALRHSYDDSPEYADELMNFLAEESWRVAKKQAHMYVFCDLMRFQDVKAIFQLAGWHVFKTPLIWYKGNFAGVIPLPNLGPRRTYEALLFCNKGDRRVNAVYPDVISVPHDKTIERAAHKPSDLYKDLLSRSCSPGNVVLDPCCGTGPIFPAAEELKLRAIGFEIDGDGYAIALDRLKAIKNKLDDEQVLDDI